MSLPPIPQSVLDLAEEMDTGDGPLDWAVFFVSAWPLAYAGALRHAAERMDAERNGNEETWFSVFGDTLREWAAEAAP